MIERLTGSIQGYAWGSTTAIPTLLGEEPTGDPQAELWLGAHPKAPAQISGRGLDAIIDEDPAGLVGSSSVDRFGPRLPYLLKVLAADQPLSLQAHPSREQAEAGFAREEAAGVSMDAPHRMFRDDWPKPEMLCALGEMDTLCGFREPAETYALFAQLGVAAAVELVTPLAQGGTSQLAEVFEQLLQLEEPKPLVDEIVAAAGRAAGDATTSGGTFGRFAGTAVELAEFYPGSAGIVAALLMNRVSFGRDQAIFLPAGNLHAYLSGTGVEIMANSDNVLRGGLTPKHIDVAELMSVLDFTPGFAGFVPTIAQGPGVYRYDTPAPEFALWRLELGDVAAPVPVPAESSGRVLLVSAGSVIVRDGSTELTLGQGQSAFVSAHRPATVTGPGTLFVAGPGVSL